MIDWTTLISKDKRSVINFANGNLSGGDFQQIFSGNPNPARGILRNHGVTYGRRLARKALRRRGVSI